MVSLGLASFFSVGALLKSSAGSTLSQLLYFPEKQKYIKWNSEGIFILKNSFTLQNTWLSKLVWKIFYPNTSCFTVHQGTP